MSEATLTVCIQDGAAACIVASEDFVHAHGLENQAIEIVAQTLATDGPSTFEGKSAMDVVGYTMSKVAADRTFSDAGFREGEGRDLVGVVELHDCFAANELITYPALGLCKEDEAHKLVERGDVTYGGKYVVNPSGGLEAKGHPLGATGLGMHFYIMSAYPNPVLDIQSLIPDQCNSEIGLAPCRPLASSTSQTSEASTAWFTTLDSEVL